MRGKHRWMLEVYRFGICVFFPVFSYWIFHKYYRTEEITEQILRSEMTPEVAQNISQLRHYKALLQEAQVEVKKQQLEADITAKQAKKLAKKLERLEMLDQSASSV